jgi:hypothetical protein
VKARALGKDQRLFLQALVTHRFYYSAGFGCGWRWGGPRQTVRMLDALQKRGLVAAQQEARGRTAEDTYLVWRPTDAGQALVAQWHAEREAARAAARGEVIRPLVFHPTGAWHVPPECQGQIVEVSYTVDAEAGVILERTLDRSDGSEVIVAYDYPARDHTWDPWNGTPKLGRRLGRCTVEYELPGWACSSCHTTNGARDTHCVNCGRDNIGRAR